MLRSHSSDPTTPTPVGIAGRTPSRPSSRTREVWYSYREVQRIDLSCGTRKDHGIELAATGIVMAEKALDEGTQLGVIPAVHVQVRCSLGRGKVRQGVEDSLRPL